MEPKQVRAVRAMAGSMSPAAIAATLGVSVKAVRRIVAREPDAHRKNVRMPGVDGRTRPAHHGDTTERDARIRAHRAGGATIRAIGEAVGCSYGTVHRVLNAHTK